MAACPVAAHDQVMEQGSRIESSRTWAMPAVSQSRFDNEPAASLQLAGELLRREPAQELLGVG